MKWKRLEEGRENNETVTAIMWIRKSRVLVRERQAGRKGRVGGRREREREREREGGGGREGGRERDVRSDRSPEK